MIFDYVNSVRDIQPKVCTKDIFTDIVKKQSVKDLITKYRNGDATAKQNLPAFCFHATFDGKKRNVKNARPSGLVMVDFDKISSEELSALIERCKQLSENKLYGILLVHITPSGKGLRVVIKAQKNQLYENCNSISDYQHTIAKHLCCESKLDEVTTDLARLSFAPMFDDIIILNNELFVGSADVINFEVVENRQQSTTNVQQQMNLQTQYDGLNLKEVFFNYFMLTGGLPNEGARNSRFYSAARDLRYICDFNAYTLAANMPDVGLSFDEVFSVCSSACQSSRASSIPNIVKTAIEQTHIDVEEDDEDRDLTIKENSEIQLPVIFRPLINTCPSDFQTSALLAILPILGTLASKVRAKYIDGETHSPSFMTILSAEQASGKSFVRKFVELLLKDIKEEDAAARAVEMAFRQEMKKCKNKKDLPTPPREIVRIVPASISVAKLLQRLDYANGMHLFSFAEELDTVIKSNQSGAWSQKSDIYRNAFDNAEYGQDYMNEDTYSAVLPVFYNLLFLGTPRQTKKFMKNVENGLCSRTCFAYIPDQFGAQMPVFGKIKEKVLEKMYNQITTLRNFNGFVDLSFLHEPIQQWLEQQRIMAVKENNRARDIFRRRSAVIGFRAVMTVAPCYFLSASKNKEMLAKFAIYVANLVLEGQLSYAEKELNQIIESGSDNKKTKSQDLFKNLPEQFDIKKLSELLTKFEMKTPPRSMIYIWKRENLITDGDAKKTYKKVK